MNLYIDVGSTNIKYKTSGNVIGTTPFVLPTVDDGVRYEVNAVQIYNVLKNIIDGIKPNRVYFSVQMHGYVLLKNGKEVTDYISWRDERAKNETPKFELTKEFGVDIKPNLPRLSIQKATVDFDEFTTLGSYLAYKFTGNNKTHVSDFAPSGFYNVRNKKAVETPFKLPKVCAEVEVVGKYDGIEICSPIGDQQCAIKGATGKCYDGYILNLGTAAQMCCIEDGFVSGEFESRPYFNGKTLCTVTRLLGGRYVADKKDEELKDELIKDYRSALKKLPVKKKMLVTGGLVNYRKKLLESVLDELGVDYTFNYGTDALDGLKIIDEGELTMRKTGIMLSEIPFANIPVLIHHAGLDFFIIDYEHGGFDYSDMSKIIMNARLSGITVIVRLPNNLRKDIIKMADMGADGFLLPMTSTPEDIREVVKYAKYAPIGERGLSTMRAHTEYNPPKILDYMKIANGRMKVYAQIETVKGVDNIKEILSVEGVDGIMVGPNDLSCDYGCLGNNNAEEILSAIEKVGKTAKDLGKDVGIITGNANYINKAKENGYNMFCKGSELNAIADYCKKIIKDIKGE